jgi:hypothetical protein
MELSEQLIPLDIDVMLNGMPSSSFIKSNQRLKAMLEVLSNDSRVITTSTSTKGVKSATIGSLPPGVAVIREHAFCIYRDE